MGAVGGDPFRFDAVGISCEEGIVRSVITATRGALKLTTAIKSPVIAVSEARRLNGSSVSDDAVAPSLDGGKASGAIERGAAGAPTSRHNVYRFILSLPSAERTDH